MNLLDLIPSWVIALAAGCAGFALGAGVQQVRIAGLQVEFADYKTQQAEALAAAEKSARLARDDLETERQGKADLVAQIDQRLVKARNDAATETETRLRGLAAGTVRVRYVAAACPDPGSAVPAAAGAASVVDGAGIELSAAAGQDVLHLRQSLSDDAAQIAGLQAYIRAIQGVRP